MTATGRVLGTTDYVAPEQAMGLGADPRSDIYSLGVVLYEMLIGQVPFHADSQVGVAMKHVNEDLPDVQQRRPEVSAAAALVVERATDKDPENRYQEVGEMIDDLSTALEVEAARAGSTTGEATSVLDAVPPAKRKLSSRTRWSWAAILLIVLVGGGALAATALIGGGDAPAGGGGALKGKGKTIPLESATDFDPKGDGEEDPEVVSLAVDGSLSTAWTSEHYDDQTFAGTKSGPNEGVGLYVAAEGAVKPSEMVIRGAPGYDAEIYAAATAAPEELEEWGEPVGTVAEAGEVAEVELDVPTPSKYFLIWFNKAAPSRDQPGRYQLEISDIKLIE
jgi:serine/threonine-protein kinase